MHILHSQIKKKDPKKMCEKDFSELTNFHKYLKEMLAHFFIPVKMFEFPRITRTVVATWLLFRQELYQ